MRNAVAKGFEFRLDDIEVSKGEVSWDVFEEHEAGLSFLSDSTNVRPKVAFILLATTFPGAAEGLAWKTCRDAIHDSAPRLAIEGLDIVPQRSAIHGRVFHPRHESGRRVGFPLDITNGSYPQSEKSVEDAHGDVEHCPSRAEAEQSVLSIPGI